MLKLGTKYGIVSFDVFSILEVCIVRDVLRRLCILPSIIFAKFIVWMMSSLTRGRCLDTKLYNMSIRY